MPSITGVLHTKSYNDTNRRPQNWREMILYEDPNPASPLVALLGAMGSNETTDDPIFHWWTQRLPTQRSPITGIYTNSTLAAAYAPANAGAVAAADATLYIKMAEADAKVIVPGAMVKLIDEAYPELGTQRGVLARVEARTLAGANSYLTVKLFQPDYWDAAPGTDTSYLAGGRTTPDTSMIAWIVGTAYAEGSGGPTALAYEPIRYFNYTQIFKNKTSATRTAMQTRLRTGPVTKNMKKECLTMHQMEMEKAFLFGIQSEKTDSEGKPLRTTAGLVNFVDALGNRVIPASSFSGTWKTDAEDWLFGVDGQLENLFRFGSQDRLVLCGSSVITAFNLLAKSMNTVTVSVETSAFGMQYTKVVCPHGVLMLKQHKLLSYEPTTRKMAIVLDMSNLHYRALQDTIFKENVQLPDADVKDDMFLTEAGLELHFPDAFRIWYNIG